MKRPHSFEFMAIILMKAESMGHKPFMVIADHLTRNGIAVLRFDDRGGSFNGLPVLPYSARVYL
ncbi:hypothetical protein L0663_23305 [Dyadobacter sp. CY107]|uniref:hypothetical protein n=1 Tax=Dyadobacter fanqingshengii TaxID=2906443 RepID=UPI001F3437F0|nr:hypothetical protein [Dyadobacter fanqingshengii]MCF2506342.1 hypothetical protein [Dyadobacter fanqingshengii]